MNGAVGGAITAVLNGGGAARIVFDPVLPWSVLILAGAVILAVLGLALWRGLAGWMARAAAAGMLILSMAGPSLHREDRQKLNDILLVIKDESASQFLAGRAAQNAQAMARLRAQVAAFPDLDLHVFTLGDGADDRGTLLETAISTALSEVAQDRVAGIVALSDGIVHDATDLGLTADSAAPGQPTTLPSTVPLHVFLTGQPDDWDRRLVLKAAPAFAILGEEEQVILRIEDSGAAPDTAGDMAEIMVSIDGDTPSRHVMPIGRDLVLPLTLQHAGMNIVQLTLAAEDGELTTKNNSLIIQISGVRDRLRVLLVSGQPHPGTRTWRNLLKSDAAVDLVHFTILRPPEKQDGVPVRELSLIAFPTQELFMEKVDQFDLIIFDRYELRGILPAAYLANIRAYIEKGGAVLVAAGPSFAAAGSLARSPLGQALPALPTGRVQEQPFVPEISELGERHPVTQGLGAFGAGANGQPDWGRWLRWIDLVQTSGHVVMQAPGGAPLLVLDRVGAGRVALLGSDHAWLWSRGFDGGGPQLELLRRLAHWMMKEPDLEEETLTATASGVVSGPGEGGAQLHITRRTLSEGARSVEMVGPDGAQQLVPLRETAPGLYQVSVAAGDVGLYRLSDGDLRTLVALGPAAPREFLETIASAAPLRPLVQAMNGGFFPVAQGLPSLRYVRAGRQTIGRGWFGVTARNAYITKDIRIIPLFPAWLALALAALLSIWGWVREGRQ